MKRFIQILSKTITFTVLVAAALPALAADLFQRPSLGTPQAPPAPSPSFSWAGAYVGVTIGAGRNVSTAKEIDTVSDNGKTAYCAPPGTLGVPVGTYYCNVNGAAHYTSTPTSSYNLLGDKWKLTTKSAVYGVLGGYNFQRGSVVYGGEFEIGRVSMQGRSGTSPANDDTYQYVNATDYTAARLRLGYAFDRILPFVTAGVALAHFNNYVADPDIPIGVSTVPTGTHTGLSLGAGIEYALTDHLILRGEVQHTEFLGQNSVGYVNVTCTVSPCQVPQWKLDRLGMIGDGTAGWRISNRLDVVRIATSYKF